MKNGHELLLLKNTNIKTINKNNKIIIADKKML